MNIYLYNWILHWSISDSGCSKKLTSGWTKTNRWITKQGKSWTMLTRFSELADIIKFYYHDNHHHCLKALPYKVKRCLARYNQRTTTTNQPINRAPNEPTRPIYAQESIFWGKNGCFWAKHPYYFGREHISENHLGTSFALLFWLGIAPHRPERPIIDQKWLKMHILGQIWPCLG